MLPVCSFESSAPEAERIWNAGMELYDIISEEPMSALYTHPLNLPMYVSATLLLTSDTQRAKNAVEQLICEFETHAVTDRFVFLTLSLAIEDLYTYTADVTLLTDQIARLDTLAAEMHMEETRCAIEEALYIGYDIVLTRLRAECGMPLHRATLGYHIAEFHKMHFDADRRFYFEEKGSPSLLLTTIVASFGFVNDDAAEDVLRYLLDHAFELPREWYGLLYMALYNLEVGTSFYACLLEGGIPQKDGSAALLCGVVAMIRYLVGVDISMLARGIECASPRMPNYISYRLMLPVDRQYLCFEGEAI